MASSESLFDFLDAPAEPGDLGMLGHYRVIEELGRGGMGYVFRARDKRLHRDVALKVMNQKVASTPFSRRRFIHEARAMAAVHHDNVATIFEVGEKAGTPFMAMEMLQGSTLETLNEAQPRLGFEQVIRYAEQIARGLAAAHAKGIVHRDIKPANIWIEPDKDRVKILDFGLALAATPVDQLAGRGAVIGTPGYLSPEQARTEPLDDRSDLYSLGVLLYEMCAGCLPLQSDSVIEQLIAILAHRPRPLREVNPEIPEPLAKLIHRLLRKEPRARIASAAVLIDELARVEKACHETSEVAQTINKLQQELSAVVGKHSNAFDLAGDMDVEVLDPFAAIPVATPATAASVGTAKPVGTMPHKPLAAPYSRPNAAAAQPKQHAWQKYVALAAVGAVVLIALPVLTYLFTRAGRSNEAILIAQSTDVGAASSSNGKDRATAPRGDQSAREPAATGNNAVQRGEAARSDQRQNQNKGDNAANNPTGKNASGNAKTGQGRPGGGVDRPAAPAKRPAAPAKRNASKNNRTAASRDQSATGRRASDQPLAGRADADANQPSAEVVLAASNAKLATDVDAGRGGDQGRATEPTQPAEASPIETRITRISTADGRGADSAVQIGGTKLNLGTSPSIAVQRRRGIDSHHSYIRFDLATVEDVRHELQSAELVLTFVGRARPEKATIRVYGMPGPGLTLWQEEGPNSLTWSLTPSKLQLAPLPLLATVDLAGPNAPAERKTGTVSISSPELTQFVRDCEDDTVTLVIAGESGTRTLRFISREGSGVDAPTLVIEAPVTASPKKANQRGGRR